MAGSEQVSDPRTAEIMASRLRLRKKKYHPPQEEPPDHPYVECNKTNEEPENTNMKTYAEIARSSTQINTSKEPKKTNIKRYT